MPRKAAALYPSQVYSAATAKRKFLRKLFFRFIVYSGTRYNFMGERGPVCVQRARETIPV